MLQKLPVLHWIVKAVGRKKPQKIQEAKFIHLGFTRQTKPQNKCARIQRKLPDFTAHETKA